VGAYCLVALAHDRVPAPTFSNEVACLRIACQIKINTPATSLAGRRRPPPPGRNLLGNFRFKAERCHRPIHTGFSQGRQQWCVDQPSSEVCIIL
jgi:hypothetical protein